MIVEVSPLFPQARFQYGLRQYKDITKASGVARGERGLKAEGLSAQLRAGISSDRGPRTSFFSSFFEEGRRKKDSRRINEAHEVLARYGEAEE